MTFPETGDTIQFTRAPTGSLCLAGQRYRVRRFGGDSFQFINEHGVAFVAHMLAVANAVWFRSGFAA
jgi:hypothetical protein